MTTIVAIDGPAGAGKSTIARALATRLGVPYLETGAMYRAVTCEVLRRGIEPADESAVVALAERSRIEVGLDRVTVDGTDVTEAIRTTEVNSAVSIVAALSGVRSLLRRQQRAWVASKGGAVVEGRDIGTVVFPDATLKIFLTASPRVRAERRVAQSGGDVEEIERAIAQRDHLDSTRDDSPLRATGEYTVVDTSNLGVDDVVKMLLEAVTLKAAAKP
jgi:cytidylate kinase